MASSLSPSQIDQFRQDGYLSPLQVLTPNETTRFREEYDAYEATVSDELAALASRDRYQYLAETHLYLPWVYELSTHPRVLDLVESILGEDLLLWDSRWFTKRPGEGTFVSWHQDGTYWALDPPMACTAWIALSDSTAANGCMSVIPGSHRGDSLPHRDTFEEDNALARGQEIAVEVDEADAVSLVLKPGEMSIHNISIVHGSKPNTSDTDRIGLAARFITPQTKHNVADPLAMLVRGEDRFGHFDLIEPPVNTEPKLVSDRRDELVARIYSNYSSVEEK
jgi:non-heme Fe2+,alpha-ketoglutarate-dependent halogenase